ncbi:MAG: DUF1501 domain-containing protein [Planctomycetota bacterium]|nr:DUF1501 domain-containing protein [Planctomycetota bacterium]
MHLSHHQHVVETRRGFSRRSFIHGVSAAAVAAGTLSFRDVIGLEASELRKRNKAMILLWMAGGPSQFETFDPKPGVETGGPTEAIDTSVPGIQIARGWEQTATAMDDIALIRSMTNKEGNHQRASYQLHTGYLPTGGLKHPHVGAAVAERIASADLDLPSVVSVGRTDGSGYLGVGYEPFIINDPNRRPDNTSLLAREDRFDRRRDLLDRMNGQFASQGAAATVATHRGFYEKAADLVLSPQLQAFDLSQEPESLRERYGSSQFGRGCLLARRLVEAGVTFIEVRSNGWDTHFENFDRTATLAGQVDPGFAALIGDLKDRGLLDSTLVVWMGEFGRTPAVNPRSGRDHFPRAFNAALAGCGVRGGQVIGRTDANGFAVEDRPVTVPDLFCTVCQALEIDPRHEYQTPVGRPMKLVDGGEPVAELFG